MLKDNILVKNVLSDSWSLIVIIASSYFALSIPLFLLFQIESNSVFELLTSIAYSIYLLDIVFSWLKYKYNEPEFVFEEKLTPYKYLKGWFIIDIIAIIPLVSIFGIPFLQLVRLIKLINVAYLMRKFRQREIQFANILSIVFFLFWIAHFAHWLACGWLALRGIDVNLQIFDNYVKSLYWTVTTITTVGYGDITPNSTWQTLYALLVEIIGVGAYGYLIGKLATHLNKRDPAKNKYLTNLENLSTLVKLRKVPKNLQKRLHEYYAYSFRQKHGFDESRFLEGLPESLNMELSIALKKDAIEKIPLFENQDENFLEEVALHLKPTISTPGDYIFKEGDEGKNVYFLVKGELEVLSGKDEKIVSVLRDGDFFGEIALFRNVPRTASIKASTYCDLYSLSKARFDYVLNKFPGIKKTIEDVTISRIGDEN